MSVLVEKLDSLKSTEVEDVAKCPLCGSGQAEFLFWNCDRLLHLPGKFGTYSCSGCGLIRISPRPNLLTIQRFYPEDYGAYTNPNSVEQVSGRDETSLKNWIRRSVLSRRGYRFESSSGLGHMIGALLTPLFYKRATYGYGDRFPRFVQAGNALEIGCGNGAYLSYLKYHGWNVQGIDLSPHAAAAAKQRFDIEVFVGTLDRAPLKSGSFDYVHLSHVLEHFFDPIDSLRNIFTLLRPGGRIYIEVPNAASFGAKLNGEFWYGWDAPRHLFTFTPETLKASLAFTGFEVTKMCSIFVETNRWAATFRRENLSGEMEDHRPTAGDEDLRSRLSSWLTTCLSPLSGDFLSCWATKS